jgi:uncharacterized protein
LIPGSPGRPNFAPHPARDKGFSPSIAVGSRWDYILRLMRIALMELRRGLDELALVGTPDELKLPGEWFRHPVEALVRVQPLLGGWRLSLSLQTRVHRVCDRCLVEVELPVSEEDSCLILPEAERPSVDEEDRVLLFVPDQEWVEVDQVVRDALRLSQPEYFVCRPECRGMCPACGQDWNEGECGCQPAAPDSPFTTLATLRKPL